MQSCPRCGTRVESDVRFCPICGLPLSASQGPTPGPTAEMPPLAQSPREFSANGTIPQAPPSQGAANDTAQPAGERWGAEPWEPGAQPISEPPAGMPGTERPAQPTPGQPPTLREYGSGAPRGYPPYRPPIGPGAQSVPNPGYPIIPQNRQTPAYPGYALRPGYAPYPAYPGTPGYPYGGYLPARPPRGETYRKALSIITIVAASLLLLGGLLIVAVTALLALTGNDQDLSIVNLLVMSALAALAGGGAGLYHAIRALNRYRSAPFSLPRFWLLFALTVVILGTGIALFALNLPTGPVELIEPLVLLSGIVPAIAVLALGLQVLKPSVTWRHAFLALTTGATLAIGAASILELLLTLALLGAASLNIDPADFNPNSSFGVVAILVLVAVIAPLVEETTKQISGFFLLPRIKGPQEAFLIGLAAGIGFAMVETSGYIGMAQADWVGIALGRVGAGLLHGMGAAMAGVGWYYIFRGQGVRGRWRIGIGCLIYAYVQHAVFNGGQVALLLIQPLQNWHVDFFDLRLDVTSVYAGGLYLIILGSMLRMIYWLRTSAPAGVPPAGVGTLASAGAVTPFASAAGASSNTPMTDEPPNTLSIGEPGSREPGSFA